MRPPPGTAICRKSAVQRPFWRCPPWRVDWSTDATDVALAYAMSGDHPCQATTTATAPAPGGDSPQTSSCRCLQLGQRASEREPSGCAPVVACQGVAGIGFGPSSPGGMLGESQRNRPGRVTIGRDLRINGGCPVRRPGGGREVAEALDQVPSDGVDLVGAVVMDAVMVSRPEGDRQWRVTNGGGR
jgi:hypothetical protein